MMNVDFPKRKLNPNPNESENPLNFDLQKIVGIGQHSGLDLNSITALICDKNVNKPVGFYGPIAPPVRGSVVRICGMMRSQHFWIRTSLSSTAAARYDRREVAGMANFKCISSVSFVRIELIFLQYTGDIDATNGPEF